MLTPILHATDATPSASSVCTTAVLAAAAGAPMHSQYYYHCPHTPTLRTHNTVYTYATGGSGVAPFTAALSHMAGSEKLRSLLSSVHMVWSAKNYATLAAFEPSLRAAVEAGAHITAHCTGTATITSTTALANAKLSGSSSAVVAPIADVPSSGHTSRSGSDTTMAASTATATTAKLSSSTATAAQHSKKRKFWQPASPLYRWFVGCVLVYLSILGNTAGWFLGRLVSSNSSSKRYCIGKCNVFL
jgi:hypothetical protein